MINTANHYTPISGIGLFKVMKPKTNCINLIVILLYNCLCDARECQILNNTRLFSAQLSLSSDLCKDLHDGT